MEKIWLQLVAWFLFILILLNFTGCQEQWGAANQDYFGFTIIMTPGEKRTDEASDLEGEEDPEEEINLEGVKSLRDLPSSGIHYLLGRVNIMLTLGTEAAAGCGEGIEQLWRGEYWEALEFFQEAAQKEESVETLNGLALSQYFWGKYKTAEETLNKAMQLNINPSDEVILENNMGVILVALKRMEEGAEYVESALEKQFKLERKNLIIEVGIEVNQALIIANRGGENRKTAEYRLIQAGMKAKEMESSEVLLDTFIDSLLLSIEYREMDLNEAIKKGVYYKMIFETILGERHPATIFRLTNIANIKITKGEYDEAIEMYGNVIEIYKEKLCENNIYISEAYANIGVCYQDKGNYEKAMEYYRKSLIISENITEGPNGSDLPYLNMGTIYWNVYHSGEALDYLIKSYHSWLQNDAYDTGMYEIIMKGLKTVYKGVGKDMSKFDEWLEEQMALEDEKQAIEQEDLEEEKDAA